MDRDKFDFSKNKIDNSLIGCHTLIDYWVYANILTNNTLRLKKQELLIGPFVTNNRLALIGLDDTKLFIIKTNWLTYFKYSVSTQIPFFSQTVDKLLGKSITELKENHDIEQVDHADLNSINVVRSKIWKNYILIQHGESEIRLEILEREKTGEYEEILKKSTGKVSRHKE